MLAYGFVSWMDTLCLTSGPVKYGEGIRFAQRFVILSWHCTFGFRNTL